MDIIQDHSKPPTTQSGHESLEVHVCHRCRWPFPKPHPSSELRREHSRICGTIEGYANTIDSKADSDDEHHSNSDDQEKEKEKTPSPKIEKRVIKESGSSAGRTEEKSIRSEDDKFSDAITEFSDTGISPGVTSEFKKVDKFENDDLNTKRSVPLVEDKVIEVSGNKDQVEDAHEILSVPSDKAKTLIEDFKSTSRDGKQAENRSSVVDVFEVNRVQERAHESQTSEHERVQERKSIGEGSGKLLTGVDASVGWSSSSLEGNWGSVSEVSDAFGKSDVSDDKSRLGRSDAFAGQSLVESEQEIIEQKTSEIKANKEAIAKVTNWSTSEAKSSDPKRLSDLVKKIEENETTTEPEKSNLTRETPKVNQESVKQESSAQTDTDEGKKVEKKTKGIPSWVRFLCCSVSIER